MPPPQRACTLSRTLRATLIDSNPATAPPPDPDNSTIETHLPSTPPPPNPTSALFSHLQSDPAVRRRHQSLAHASPQTLSVHAGDRVRSEKDTRALLDAIQTPIAQTATFTFQNTQEVIEYNLGTYPSYEYARYGNPTTRVVEKKMMALDRAEDCLLSTSGMCAVTTMLLALVPQGSRILLTTDCYRRTRQFVRTVLPKMGVSAIVLDPADVNGLETALQQGNVSLYFSESPTNPMIRVVDVPAIARLCKKYNAISVFDTTFATPLNFRPMDFGADLVLHSGTKYLSGHQDVMCGALSGRVELIDKVRALHGILGGVVDPHAAFLINRGIKTLGVRMQAHNRNANAVSEFLSTHPKVAKVNFPTLSSHPDYEVGCRLFKGNFGGVLSFELAGNGDPWSRETFEAGGRFVDGLNIAYIGPSLGGCETLVEQVCIMGYFNVGLKERKALGINNGLIRFACGIEDTQDLINDIEMALRLV